MAEAQAVFELTQEAEDSGHCPLYLIIWSLQI
jgi:hypothetical protein